MPWGHRGALVLGFSITVGGIVPGCSSTCTHESSDRVINSKANLIFQNECPQRTFKKWSWHRVRERQPLRGMSVPEGNPIFQSMRQPPLH